MSSDPILKVEGVTKDFRIYRRAVDRLAEVGTFGLLRLHRPFRAVDHVSFEVRPGETVGLLGVNGSGKSTLLQMVAGTMSPSEGRILVRGRVAALLQLGAGFIPEVTGRENAILAARLYGLDEREAMDTIAWVSDFAELGGHLDTPVKFYSSGMYARLAFAVAVSVRPDLILIDEALSVGDHSFQMKAEAYLKSDLAHAAKIIVSHDLKAIARHCDRAIVLNRGALVYDGGTLGALSGMAASPAQPLATRQRGQGDVRVESVALKVDGLPLGDDDGIRPGAEVTIEVDLQSDLPSGSVASIGHFWSDPSGRQVFGADGEAEGSVPLVLEKGRNRASMTFAWPRVSKGTYTLNLALVTLGKDARIMQARVDAAAQATSTERSGWEVVLQVPTHFTQGVAENAEPRP